MSIRIQLIRMLGSSLLLVYAGISHAAFTDFVSGWPRFIVNQTEIDNHVKGDTAYFNAYNRNRNVFWREEGESRVRVKKPSFSAWAEIDVSDSANPALIAGGLEIWGQLFDSPKNSLLFSSSFVDLGWDNKNIAFRMGGDHKGFVCELGFCSESNESLIFNLNRRFRPFDGNFSEDFHLHAKTVATVPIPAAAWLFGSALFGMFGVVRRRTSIA